MKRLLILFVLMAVTAIASVLLYRALFAEPEVVLSSPLTDEMMVMRTKGGMLEVSRVRAREVFDSQIAHSLLFIDLDPTITRIRVPAVYTYRIPLAPEWKVKRVGDYFVVVAPRVQPALPVAVDLAKIEKHASGTWSFFTGTESLDRAERAVTAKLASKATSRAYILLQRDHARQTVAEFVQKWLVTQEAFKDVDTSHVRVYFSDEPIDSLGPDVLPLVPPKS